MSDDLVMSARELGNQFPIKNHAEWVDFASLYLVRCADRIEALERENADLRHDIARHVEIAAKEATRAEKLMKALDEEGAAADSLFWKYRNAKSDCYAARRESLEEAAEAVRSMKANPPKIERGQAIYAYHDGLTDAEASIRNMLKEQKDG
jgi:cell fate (sporulation/competence/biofilm development) regulator YlbF (YheA/YmcA/DUF963 family)